MIAMHSPQERKMILLAKPEELRRLADELEAQQKEAKAGDSVIKMQMEVRDFWSGDISDMVFEVGFLQTLTREVES